MSTSITTPADQRYWVGGRFFGSEDLANNFAQGLACMYNRPMSVLQIVDQLTPAHVLTTWNPETDIVPDDEYLAYVGEQ